MRALATFVAVGSLACVQAPAPGSAAAGTVAAVPPTFEVRTVERTAGDCSLEAAPCARFPVLTGGVPPGVREAVDRALVELVAAGAGIAGGAEDETGPATVEAAAAELLAGWTEARAALPADAPAGYHRWTDERRMEVIHADPRVLSVELTLYSYTGGAHPNTFVELGSFDLASGEALPTRSPPTSSVPPGSSSPGASSGAASSPVRPGPPPTRCATPTRRSRGITAFPGGLPPHPPVRCAGPSAAVARAAMETGVARRPVGLEEYRVELERHLGKARHLMRLVINQARRSPKRVVFPEGTEEKVLRAAHLIADEGFARPILLGMRRPVHLLQRGCATKDVVNMAAIAVLDAQELEAREKAEAGERQGAEAVPEPRPVDVPAWW